VAHAERVPLTAIAPTVLGLLGVDVPATMREKPLL
jgi:bisphosphoglycerate-independent phosphoglycerate mutase (AlkP superfamily)